MRTLHMMRLEVSGARSDLERLWAREQRVESTSQVELQASLAAELRFARETKSQAEECRRMLHLMREKSETESLAQGEKVKASEVEVERKSRTPVWSPVGWSGWQGWGARWETGEKWTCVGTSYWTSASVEGYAEAAGRGQGVAPASERPLKTATTLLEPVRVEVADAWFGQRTPPGLASRGAPHGAPAGTGEVPSSVENRRLGLENCKHKGGWYGCELCRRSTTQRCSLCRAVVCKSCYQEHLEESCRMSDFRLCAVCGANRSVSACDRRGTSFCSRHTDHDCVAS